MPFLTIVIPCYNAEMHIPKLLDSLNSQLDNDFEIIFVDDCSKDNTVNVIETYSFNENIKHLIIKNENNCGPGASRNTGIKYANGKYITFIDSDDCIDDRFITLCKQKISEYIDLDCLIFDFEIKSGEASKKYSMYIGSNKPTEEEALLSPNDAMVYINGATCGKIYRTEMIKENNIEFLPYYRGEDIPFTKTALAFSKQILYVQKPLYHYYNQSTSIMHSVSSCPKEEIIERIEYIKTKTNGKYILETEAIFTLNCLYSLVKAFSKNKTKAREIKALIKNLEKDYPKWYKNSYIKNYPIKYRVVLFLIHCRFVCLLKGLFLMF